MLEKFTDFFNAINQNLSSLAVNHVQSYVGQEHRTIQNMFQT